MLCLFIYLLIFYAGALVEMRYDIEHSIQRLPDQFGPEGWVGEKDFVHQEEVGTSQKLLSWSWVSHWCYKYEDIYKFVKLPRFSCSEFFISKTHKLVFFSVSKAPNDKFGQKNFIYLMAFFLKWLVHQSTTHWLFMWQIIGPSWLLGGLI